MRAWWAFQHDNAFVYEALREGDFDYTEVAGAVEETRFFQMLLGEGVLQELAREYPTPRKKEEVPLWLYLSSELTLRLHGASGFGAYPYILHCGGLIHALGPDQVKSHRDKQSGEQQTLFEGYNKKNHYTRTTPCDKDFLRKLAKDTDAEALERWFGQSVVRQYQKLEAFDEQGIFLIDGTYLFVPLQNDRYEGSCRLRFDESGHPVDKEQYESMSPETQRRCQWRRCYRAVTLSHTTRQKAYSLRCGVKVLPGRSSETPWVWPVAKQFVHAVGKGVMKLLVFDRGLVDGETIGRLRELDVDCLFPLKKRMDVWEDAKVLAQTDRQPWQVYEIPEPEPILVPPDRPEVVQRREDARQRTLQELRLEEPPAPPTRSLEAIEYKYIEPSRVWESCPVPVGVLLIKNHYANGDTLDWALASTRQFSNPLDMWHHYTIRCAIEEDHRQEKLYWDLSHFRSTRFSLIVNQVVFVEIAYSFIQIFLRMIDQGKLVGKTRDRLLDMLLPHYSKVVVYYKHRYGLFNHLDFYEDLLTLKESARQKAVAKIRQLRRRQVSPLKLPLREQ